MKQKFVSMRKSQANIRSEANICCNMYFLHEIEHLYANLCEYLEANMKRMMRKNGVCKYTETCENEANKIHIRLDSLRSE
jgi:hypothetical protein